MPLPDTISASQAQSLGWSNSNTPSSSTSSSTLPDTISASDAQNMGWNTTPDVPNPNQEEQHGILGGIASGLLKTPARLATNVINAGQILTGNKPTTPFSGKFLGQVNPIGETGNFGTDLKESLGAGAELSSYLIGGEGAGEVGETTLKGLIKEGAIQGAKTGAVAGGVGALGNSQVNDAGVGQTIAQTGAGIVGGGVGGGILGAAAPAVAQGLNKLGIKMPAIGDIARANSLSDLQDRISPKPTISEVRLAQDQGRIIPGEKGGIFSSGTSDQIIPTDKVGQASLTVDKYIPDHADLSNPELSTAIKGKVSDIATELQPKMEAVKITPENVKQIYKDSAALKQTQNAMGDTADSKAIIKKSQGDLKSIIQDKPVSTMNDLWKRTQAYDNSIPANVKNANINSPEGLQLKKHLWLQNRQVLTNATHNVSTGLDETSASAFSDMSDLYEAQKGLRSQAKLNAPEPSKISKIYNSPTGKLVRGISKVGLGLGALGEGAKFISGQQGQ